MRPETITYHIGRDELDSITLPKSSNLVIVHVPHQNKDTITKSGIIVVGDQDFKPANHAERWGYIYKTTEEFDYDGCLETESWDTDIECVVGDKVWFDFRAAMYAFTLECDGDWYKVLKYTSLYVVQRKDTIIPLNGYLLMHEYVAPKKSDLLLKDETDDRFCVVVYAGKPNKKYTLDVFTDDIKVEVGDHLLFEAETAWFRLEHALHKEFPDDVVLQHRKRVLGVVDKDHKRLIRVRHGVIGVVPRKVKTEVGGIVLTNPHNRHRIADVVASEHDLIKEGDIVVIPKKKGTEFNDIEYFTDERILYYETA